MKFIVLFVIFGLLFYFKEEIVLAVRMLLGLEKDNEAIEEKAIQDYTLGEVATIFWRYVKKFFIHRSTISINGKELKIRSSALIILPISMTLCYLLVDQGDVLLSYTLMHMLVLYLCTNVSESNS